MNHPLYRSLASCTLVVFSVSLVSPSLGYPVENERDTSEKPEVEQSVPLHDDGSVASGHSWLKAWDPALEQPAPDALVEMGRSASLEPSPSPLEADDLRDPQLFEKDPEEKSGLEEVLLNRRQFLREMGRGIVAAAVAPAALQTSVPPTVAAAQRRVEREVGIGSPPTVLDRMSAKLRLQVETWREKTRSFVAGQRMEDPVSAVEGFDVQAYRSYLSNPSHQWDRYLGVERFWVYDMGVALTYLVRRGELAEARWLADQMIAIARQMEAQGQPGGWRCGAP